MLNKRREPSHRYTPKEALDIVCWRNEGCVGAISYNNVYEETSVLWERATTPRAVLRFKLAPSTEFQYQGRTLVAGVRSNENWDPKQFCSVGVPESTAVIVREPCDVGAYATSAARILLGELSRRSVVSVSVHIAPQALFGRELIVNVRNPKSISAPVGHFGFHVRVQQFVDPRPAMEKPVTEHSDLSINHEPAEQEQETISPSDHCMLFAAVKRWERNISNCWEDDHYRPLIENRADLDTLLSALDAAGWVLVKKR